MRLAEPDSLVDSRSALTFPIEEYEARVTVLRHRMATAQLDLLLIDQFEHLAYYTGYLPTAAMYQACLMPLEGEPMMLSRGLDEPMLREQSWVCEATCYLDTKDPLALLAAIIERRGWSRARIGVERDSHFLFVERLAKLESLLPDATFVGFERVMWELRLRKSPREIALLRRAASIADIACVAGIEVAAEGVAEREVAAAIYSAGIRAGADNTRMVLMASGPRSDNLHGSLGHRILGPGDILHLELVPHYKVYTARLMRPTVIGTPDSAQAGTARQMVALQNAQYEAMKPGVVARDIDRILRQGILDAGLRESYTNITGYTLGLVCIPRTSDFTRIFLPDSDWVLEEGMVFHMYCWAQGMAFSDTILITAHGAEQLTRTDRHLFVR